MKVIIAECRQIEAAILKLGKQLRSVSSLPLKIVAVQPLSAAARHTAAFPPLPHPFAGGQNADSSAKVDRCLNTIDLLAQLEGSGMLTQLHAGARTESTQQLFVAHLTCDSLLFLALTSSAAFGNTSDMHPGTAPGAATCKSYAVLAECMPLRPQKPDHSCSCVGKWPDHPHAYAKAKAAMGCLLTDELASAYGLHAHASEHCIDVLAEGFAFRIFLASERHATYVSLHCNCKPVLCLEERVICKSRC